MTAINKFNKSMIYTIRSPHTDQYYIGSTTQPLCKRFGDHKTHYKEYLKKPEGNFITSFKIIELGDSYIELLEEINCDNRPQLHRREGEIIREHKINCVNRLIAGRTSQEYTKDNCDKQKQYYKDNFDTIREYKKQHRLTNSDKIKQYEKEYRLTNAEKIKEYKLINADKIRQSSKEYYIANEDKRKAYNKDNRDKINERARIKYAEKKLLKDLSTITI